MRVFRVSFMNQGKVYEIYARRVRQGELYGFVEVEELLFEPPSGLLVDPSSEKLQREFEGVNRTIVPIHSVLRIDEVEKEGQGKIRDLDGDAKVTPFPGTLHIPPKPSD